MQISQKVYILSGVSKRLFYEFISSHWNPMAWVQKLYLFFFLTGDFFLTIDFLGAAFFVFEMDF